MILNDWQDVDGAVEQIGRIEIESGALASEMGHELYAVLGRYSKELAALGEKKREIESAVGSFCLLRKSEFAKKRSKQLIFGKIAFRVAERIAIPEGFEQTVIATLKMLGRDECIEIKERLDRNGLKKLGDDELARCGARRVKEDHFRIEPNLDAVSEKLGKSLSFPQFEVDVEKLARSVRPRERNAGAVETADCMGKAADAA